MATTTTMTSDKVHIDLTGVPETALFTLWIKATSTRLGRCDDEWAVRAVDRIADYDFSAKFSLSSGSASYFLPSRTRNFDKWITQFLDKHCGGSGATVVNLACGVESRALRLMPAYPGVRWVDVDLPEMVKLRKQLLPDPDGDYSLVAASVLEDLWLNAIPADRPTIVVMEGLLMYLVHDEVESLLRRLVGHFKLGELAFDTAGSLSLPAQKIGVMDFLSNTGSRFTWVLEDPRGVEKMDPRLKFCQVVRHGDFDEVDEWPFWYRWLVRIGNHLPFLRNGQNNLRFEFDAR